MSDNVQADPGNAMKLVMQHQGSYIDKSLAFGATNGTAFFTHH